MRNAALLVAMSAAGQHQNRDAQLVERPTAQQRNLQGGYLLSGDDFGADEMGEELSGYVGDDLGGYVGDGMDGYVGGRRGRPRPHMQQFLQPMPIPETVLTAAQTVDIPAYPQRGFKPHRLVVPSTISPLFKINDIKVGQETQYVSSGTIYAECFSEVAVAVTLKGTRASLGNNIILNVTNRDAANSQTFSAMLLGFTESN
jgi:hypothetical protein